MERSLVIFQFILQTLDFIEFLASPLGLIACLGLTLHYLIVVLSSIG